MMLLRNYLIAATLLFTSGMLSGQDKVVSIGNSEGKWRLGIQQGSKQEREPAGTILLTFARDQYRDPSRIRIEVPYRLQTVASPAGDGITLLRIKIITGKAIGDSRYRDFQTSNVLIPDQSGLEIKWWKKSDSLSTSVIFSREITPLSDSSELLIPMLHFDPGRDSLCLTGIRFGFSQRRVEQFLERTRLIDDYYASAAIIDTLLAMGGSMIFSDPDQIPTGFLQIQEIYRMVETIRKRNFQGVLLAEGYDPAGLAERFTELHRMSRTLKFNFEDHLNAREVIRNNDSHDLSRRLTDRLMFYISLSQLVDGIRGDIFLDYLSQFFSGNVFENDLEVTGKILARMYPDARSDTLMRFFSGILLQTFLERARQLNGERRYHDAFLLMSLTGKYLEANPFTDPGRSPDGVLGTALSGIYLSYLGIASSGLAAGQPDLAEEYLKKADSYRSSHPEIPEDSSYQDIYRILLAGRLERCDQLLAAGSYRSALNCLDSLGNSNDLRIRKFLKADLVSRRETARAGLFEEALATSENLFQDGLPEQGVAEYQRALALLGTSGTGGNNLTRLDSLTTRVNRYQYELLVTLAGQSYYTRDYLAASERFDSASLIARKVGFITDPILDTLARNARKKLFLEEIRSGQPLIWNNELDSAVAFAGRMSEKADREGFAADREVALALASFSGKMGGQECRIAADSFNILVIRSENLLRMGNYSRAVAVMKGLLTLAGQYPDCGLATLQIRDSIRKYEPAARYAELLAATDVAAVSGDFTKAVDILFESEKLYHDYRLDRLGIVRRGSVPYVMARQNPLLAERACGYCYQRQAYQDALVFLKMMKSFGVPEKSAAAIQQQLGRQLALYDRQKFPKEDPVQLVRNYTERDGWFRVFQQAYMDAWR